MVWPFYWKKSHKLPFLVQMPDWNVSWILVSQADPRFPWCNCLKKEATHSVLLFTGESLVNHYFQWPQVNDSVTMPFNKDFHIDFDWRLLMTLDAAQLNDDTKTDTEGKLLCFFLEKQKKISSLLKKNCWPTPLPHYRDQARWPHRETTSWSVDKNRLEKHEVRRQTIEKSKQKKDSKVRHHF